jgi:toxin ParE1/3/4
MATYELTKKAVEDLATIWIYTLENWSENQADKYYSLLIEGFDEIAGNPGIGKSFSDIIEGMRGLRVGRHIVFFRLVSPDKVEITRILHERMDLKKRVLEP